MEKSLLPTEAGYRRCLKCNESFHSRGAGNRICKDCRKINAAFGHISDAQLAAQRGAKRLNGKPLADPNSYESSFC